MSVRLYPNESPEGLERLAGVPEGTYAKLKAYETKQPKEVGPAMSAWYDKLYHDNNMVTLYNFLNYGWGRLTADAWHYIEEHFESYEAGSTDNFYHAQALVRAMGITAEGITSVRWN